MKKGLSSIYITMNTSMRIVSVFFVSAVLALGFLPSQSMAQEEGLLLQTGETQVQQPQPQEPPQPQPRPIIPMQEGQPKPLIPAQEGQEGRGEQRERQEQRPAPQQFFEEEGEEQEPEEFIDLVDPRELKQVFNQLNDLKRQIKQVLKKAQKQSAFANEVAELNSLSSEIDGFSSAIRNAAPEDQREALQGFYDAQLWETLNTIRVKIELPQEFKNIEKDLKRLEKLITQKKFSIEKVDLGIVRAMIDEIKSAVAEGRSQFNQGNFEDAREALQVIYEGAHPGEVMGVLQQLRDMNQRIKKLKVEVKEVFHEALAPVYEAIQNGDFREANMMLQDIRNDLWRLFDKVKGKSGVNADMQQKLQNLEERLQQKQQQMQEEQPSSKPQSYQPYQASVLDALSNWFSNVFSR